MKTLSIFLIRLYQILIRPMIGEYCRFYPTCSHYAITSLKDHGFWKGWYFTTKRLLKCGPWHPGGVDLPKERASRKNSNMNSGL
ncbi:MAG: membrane protein insertion efficiency factor YidD [Verrucomicrobia bacterium]|nr:membrane protein insertion efficiency factor YidD [Verrucomicrobiota bacterium]